MQIKSEPDMRCIFVKFWAVSVFDCCKTKDIKAHLQWEEDETNVQL